MTYTITKESIEAAKRAINAALDALLVEDNRGEAQKPPLTEWIRVLPLGAIQISGCENVICVTPKAVQIMVESFRSGGADLLVNFEGRAAGWIKKLEARSDGLWAKVEWTEYGREYLSGKKYRYFLPRLRIDPTTRYPIIALLRLELTDIPAIKRLPQGD